MTTEVNYYKKPMSAAAAGEDMGCCFILAPPLGGHRYSRAVRTAVATVSL